MGTIRRGKIAFLAPSSQGTSDPRGALSGRSEWSECLRLRSRRSSYLLYNCLVLLHEALKEPLELGFQKAVIAFLVKPLHQVREKAALARDWAADGSAYIRTMTMRCLLTNTAPIIKHIKHQKAHDSARQNAQGKADKPSTQRDRPAEFRTPVVLQLALDRSTRMWGRARSSHRQESRKRVAIMGPCPDEAPKDALDHNGPACFCLQTPCCFSLGPICSHMATQRCSNSLGFLGASRIIGLRLQRASSACNHRTAYTDLSFTST